MLFRIPDWGRCGFSGPVIFFKIGVKSTFEEKIYVTHTHTKVHVTKKKAQ